MEITLIRSGGLSGKTMIAKAEWKFSIAEWNDLIKTLERPVAATRKTKDAFYYALQMGKDEKTSISISVNNIPEKYRSLFKALFENLKPDG